MTTAAVIGASGYSGAELLRILAARTDIVLGPLTAAGSAGRYVDELYPHLDLHQEYQSYDPRALRGTDIAFIALPSGEAMSVVPEILTHVGRVIDLGGDFRLSSEDVYQKFYGHVHASPHLLGRAVYGLPEINRPQIASSTLVANPGCYPTSVILGLMPALKAGIVSSTRIIINSLSGVSGAGRSSSVDMSFAEINDNVRAYKLGRHQHLPEMESILGKIAGTEVSASFVPHLVPMTRGIYTTIHAPLTSSIRQEEVEDLYDEAYADEPFVRLRRVVPQVKDVLHTNLCDVHPVIDAHARQLVVVSAIDNLMKGAAGQAVQNMNIMLGLPEQEGLEKTGHVIVH